MEKIKENKKIVIIIFVIILGIFYWFQIRPIIIKKNCSVAKVTISADTGVTKEQAEINKIKYDNKECDNPFDCAILEKNTKERDPSPERVGERSVSKDKYEQCLREHGL